VWRLLRVHGQRVEVEPTRPPADQFAFAAACAIESASAADGFCGSRTAHMAARRRKPLSKHRQAVLVGAGHLTKQSSRTGKNRFVGVALENMAVLPNARISEPLRKVNQGPL